MDLPPTVVMNHYITSWQTKNMPYKTKCRICKREVWEAGKLVKFTDYWLCLDCLVKVVKEKSK